jgi:hypothetical protein
METRDASLFNPSLNAVAGADRNFKSEAGPSGY